MWARLSSAQLVVAAAAVLAVIQILIPDKIAQGDGFGWDGLMYRDLAERFWQRYREGFTAYEAGRIGPPLLVRYALLALSAPLTKANLLFAFAVMNAVLLVASAWLWTRIARRLRVGPAGLWIGFLAGFCGFFPLKVVSHYPSLTDVGGYFLGWAMLAAYLRGSSLALGLCLVAGQITWPTALPVAAALLLFRKSSEGGRSGEGAADRPVAWRAAVVALVPAVGLGVFVVHAMVNRITWLNRIMPGHAGIAELVMEVWPLSLACACVYLAGAYFVLLREGAQLLRVRTWVRLALDWRTYLALAVLVGLVFMTRSLATRGAGPYSPAAILALISWFSITAPLNSLVAHVVYFGPIVLVVVLGWRTTARGIAMAGPGVVLVAAMAILFSLDSESRHLTLFFPFFVAFAAKAVDAEPPSRGSVLLFALLSLLASKVWLVFGGDAHLFLSNVGPWMSHTWYLANGVLAVAAGFACLRLGLVPRAGAADPAAGDQPGDAQRRPAPAREPRRRKLGP